MFGCGGAVEQEAEAAVDDLAPADPAAVVEADPGGAAEAVADDVVDGHIGGEAAAVVDVGGLAVGAVGTGYVVVVAAEDNGAEFAGGDGAVEGQGDLAAALGVGVKDPGLGADDEAVLLGGLDPGDVVAQLLLDFGGRGTQDAVQGSSSDAIGEPQIVGGAGGTHPAEGPETVVEAHRPQDVLYVGRVTEARTRLVHHRGAGPGTLQQEGVAVVEEVGPPGGVFVDEIGVTAQRCADGLAEGRWVGGEQFVGLRVSHPDRVVATRPGVVERGLVGAQVDEDVFLEESLPDVDDVADVGDRHRFFTLHRCPRPRHQIVQTIGKLVYPTLFVPLAGGGGVDLGADRDAAGDVARLGLGTGHAAEAGSEEELAVDV